MYQYNNFTLIFTIYEMDTDMQCVQALSLWCDNSSVINHHMFKGYKGGNKRRRSNEFLTGSLIWIQKFVNCPNILYHTILISQANIPIGYDFLDTSKRRFHVYVWYNSSFSRDNGHHPMTVLRVSRLVNMVLTLAYNLFQSTFSVRNSLISKIIFSGVSYDSGEGSMTYFCGYYTNYAFPL